jgi:hypothetical protein
MYDIPDKEPSIDNNILNTNVLPKWNCNNCSHMRSVDGKSKEIVDTEVGLYSVECCNVVHPLIDCVLRGFEAHSEQPGFSQTLNK